MAREFQVGDRVKVKNESGYYNNPFETIGIITRLESPGIYEVEFDRSIFHIDEYVKDSYMVLINADDLELCFPSRDNDIKNWKIVIRSNENHIRASFFENGMFVNSAVIKDDIYDRLTAVNAAIKKLFGKQKESEPEKIPFNVGDIVEVTDKYMSCPAGLMGVCVEFSDNQALIDFKVPYSFTHHGLGDRLDAPTGYYIDTKCLKKVSEQK